MIIVRGLPAGVRLDNASGITRAGDPYIRVFLRDGVLEPGHSISQLFVLSDTRGARPAYQLTLLSGQGTP